MRPRQHRRRSKLACIRHLARCVAVAEGRKAYYVRQAEHAEKGASKVGPACVGMCMCLLCMLSGTMHEGLKKPATVGTRVHHVHLCGAV